MDDYIKRSDAIKTVCGDCEYYSTNDCEDCRLDRLTKIPAADVRPVVFCRDCRFWGGRNGKNECSLITSLADPRIWLKTQPDDFCSSGERREGGTP